MMSKAKILFACDLDNTLIYSSHKLNPAQNICVEHYQGREQSFVTPMTRELLRQVTAKVKFVPVTTRSLEQYRRIEWPQGQEPKLAAVANGAVLLTDGVIDAEWREESARLVAPHLPQLYEWQEKLARRYPDKTCRLVDDSYLFLALDSATTAAEAVKSFDPCRPLSVEQSGRKIYFFPPQIDKGTALKRLTARLNPPLTVAAGDSNIDLPMLNLADISFYPDEKIGEDQVFAEVILRKILDNREF